jgi:hypothetical protein
MKEEEQKNQLQKQILISRLYKTKNTSNTNKPLPKPD